MGNAELTWRKLEQGDFCSGPDDGDVERWGCWLKPMSGRPQSPVCVCSVMSDSLDCSLPGSSVHGVFQARILEWVAISTSMGVLVFLTQGSNFPVVSHAGPRPFLSYLDSFVALLP